MSLSSVDACLPLRRHRISPPKALVTLSLAYLPALDGLRAIAVLAVMLYHGGVAGFSGGLLGVDVFFVISGYLITTLLLIEVDRTRASTSGAFYLRRARRLFARTPAAAGRRRRVRRCSSTRPIAPRVVRADALAALVYMANWAQIWRHQSYFAQFGTPSPLRHVWSLAVEEQWYLVWPPLSARLLKVCRRRLEGVLATVVLLAVASAAWMSHLVHGFADPSRAYFGTDTAGADAARGRRLAIILRRWPITRSIIRHAIGVAGALAFAAFCWAMTRYRGTTPALYHFGFLAFGSRLRSRSPRSPPTGARRCRGRSRSPRSRGSGASRTPSTCGTG